MSQAPSAPAPPAVASPEPGLSAAALAKADDSSASVAASADPIKIQNSEIANPQPRHRRGQIARLPKEIRWRINEMLDDGLPYREIIQQLGEHGTGLNEDILYRWKMGGYQDHLREQRLLAQCAARRERALALLSQTGQISGFQATQQIATAQICETMTDLGADILREALIANPLNYFRMLNAFSRLTNGGLKCERHLADEAARKAAARHQRTPRKKGITPESVQEMKAKLNLM